MGGFQVAEFLSEYGAVPTLTTLSLNFCEVTDNGLFLISALPSLTELSCVGCYQVQSSSRNTRWLRKGTTDRFLTQTELLTSPPSRSHDSQLTVSGVAAVRRARTQLATLHLHDMRVRSGTMTPVRRPVVRNRVILLGCEHNPYLTLLFPFLSFEQDWDSSSDDGSVTSSSSSSSSSSSAL